MVTVEKNYYKGKGDRLKKLTFVIVLLLCTVVTACTAEIEQAVEVVNPEPVVLPKQEEPALEATIIAVGDLMFHMPQVSEARTEDGYDFRLPFEKIKPAISQADLAIGNFETTVHEKRRLSGFPRFNSPPEVLEAIADTGFDVMVTANNHSVDTGKEGAENTIALIKKNNMLPVGTGEGVDGTVVDVKGIKVGILAYTYSTNGLPAPAGYVAMIDEEDMKADIEELKKSCDFLVVYIHAGAEYNRGVEDETEKLFKFAADAGADSVLGSHPHVARKSEIYHTRDRDVLINYSMGNFISNQDFKYTDIGTMTKLELIQKEGITSMKDFEIITTYRLKFVEGGKTKRRVIPVTELDSYSHISEDQKLYIRKTKYELSKLINEEKRLSLKVE